MQFNVGYSYDLVCFDILEEPFSDSRVVELDADFVRRWQRARAEFDACQEILAERWKAAAT
jgi:hypothetical protein